MGEAGWRISAPASAGAESPNATFKVRLAASVAAVDLHPLLSRRVGVASPAFVLVGKGERRRHRQRQNCNCDQFHFNAPQTNAHSGSNESTLTDPRPLVQPLACGILPQAAAWRRGSAGLQPVAGGHLTTGRQHVAGQMSFAGEAGGGGISRPPGASSAKRPPHPQPIKARRRQTAMAGRVRSSAFTGADPSRAGVFQSARDRRRMGQNPFPASLRCMTGA